MTLPPATAPVSAPPSWNHTPLFSCVIVRSAPRTSASRNSSASASCANNESFTRVRISCRVSVPPSSSSSSLPPLLLKRASSACRTRCRCCRKLANLGGVSGKREGWRESQFHIEIISLLCLLSCWGHFCFIYLSASISSTTAASSSLLSWPSFGIDI
ncbi:hypothetical protein BDZ88DRAFT_66435 [Geranomyces variabilis]|nr:hypothetical protein BDZ88DRAFT_66435 [Geranomyces variabilis]